jgi:cbb3-type cytochrome oxidase maturation protein
MDILLLLIPCAVSLGLLALAAFFWSLNAKQYEDLDGAAVRILLDDEQSS